MRCGDPNPLVTVTPYMASDIDLIQLIKKYVRQQTLDPLRSIGRTLIYGTLGAAMLGVGSVLLALGVMRLLQSGEAIGGRQWSFFPYFGAAALLLILSILAVRFIRRSKT